MATTTMFFDQPISGCLPITVSLSLAPSFLYKARKFGYSPGDLKTFQLLQKMYPNQDSSDFSRQGLGYDLYF